MEAVGKNLFAFFSDDHGDNDAKEGDEEVVVHVHFGMSGVWAVYDKSLTDEEPEVKPTTRLRLEEIAGNGKGGGVGRHAASNSASEYITHLSAMTVAHGTPDLYSAKKATLGQDPLRSDADPELLYSKIAKSKKSIGRILMDQSYFAGPGNIYRAEILFLAGVYPTTTGMNLDRPSFDKVWNVSVSLLRRGYDTGSILTVDPNVDPHVARRGERRYIYNRSACARCGGEVSSWDMAGRTCYACEGGECQPKIKVESCDNESHSKEVKREKVGKGDDDRAVAGGKKKAKKAKQQQRPRQHVPFISHCAPINIRQRLEQGGAERLTIAEIRSVMERIIAEAEDDLTDDVTSLPPKSARKAVHIEALDNLLLERGEPSLRKSGDEAVATAASVPLPPPAVSAEEAAREKAASGENRAVEHVAELSREQAVSAISATPATVKRTPKQRKQKKTSGVRRKDESGGNERTSQQDTIIGSLPPPVVSSDEVVREEANKGEIRVLEQLAEPSPEQAVSAISVTPMPAPVKRIPRKRKKKKTNGVQPENEMDNYGRSSEQNASSESTVPPEEAAREKAANGENRARKHVVELSHEQTASVQSVTPSPAPMKRIPRKRKHGKSVGVQPKNEMDGNGRSSRQKRLKL